MNKQLKVERRNRRCWTAEKIDALNGICTARFHVGMVAVMEMLMLALTVLVMNRTKVFALHLEFPSLLFSIFALLFVRRTVGRRRVYNGGRGAVAIAYG